MQRLPALARSLAILLLVTGLAASAAAQAGTDQEAHVELILDASGSMFNRLEDGRYRIVAAKEVLAELIAALPANANLNVGYRAYGSELQATAAGSCEDSKLLVPIEGVQRQQLLDTVKGTQARGATPIAYSLQLALNDLEGRAGKKVVVLITDGEEGCAGDVRAAAEALTAAGIDLRIIGFDLNEYARAAFQGLGVFENLVLRDQTFHADLPAGAYVAKVSDAHSAEPLTITGLTVTPEGPNAFEFELAPRLDVVVTPATSTPNAGATLTVAWEGAPDVRNGYIALPARPAQRLH